MALAEYPTTAAPVARLIEEFNKLPGIGPKTAQRLTYFLIKATEDQARALGEAILSLKGHLTFCSQCQNVTQSDPCPICQDQERDTSVICIVEEPLDILPIERSGSYKGLYHVLHGVISPINGVGPDELKLRQLLPRLGGGKVREVILATNPNLEGEATAMYIQRLISPLGIRVTRLARGLPVGGDLEYADDVTITRALQGRQEF